MSPGYGLYYCSTSGPSTPLTVSVYRDQLAAKGYPNIENPDGLTGIGGRYDDSSGCYYRIALGENKGYGKELAIINSTTDEDVTVCGGGAKINSGAGSDNLIGTVNICTGSLNSSLNSLHSHKHKLSQRLFKLLVLSLLLLL